MAGNSMWFRDDVRNILRGSISVATYIGSERAPVEAAAFRAGWLAGIEAVAIALGIDDMPEYLQPTAGSIQQQITRQRNGS